MGFPKLIWVLGFDHSFKWDVIETHINLSAFLVSWMINGPLQWVKRKRFLWRSVVIHETISQIKLSEHSK